MNLLSDLPLVAPLLIFSARVLDVTLGTVRIINLSRGNRWLASALGFLELLVWLVAMREIFTNLDNPAAYLAYAGGFAAGTWAGMAVESKLAMGTMAVQVITRTDASDLIEELNSRDFGVTAVSARGISGRVRLIISIIKRRELDRALEIVERLHPRAFVSVTDVRRVNEGIFPASRLHRGRSSLIRGRIAK